MDLVQGAFHVACQSKHFRKVRPLDQSVKNKKKPGKMRATQETAFIHFFCSFVVAPSCHYCFFYLCLGCLHFLSHIWIDLFCKWIKSKESEEGGGGGASTNTTEIAIRLLFEI